MELREALHDLAMAVLAYHESVEAFARQAKGPVRCVPDMDELYEKTCSTKPGGLATSVSLK